MSRRYAIVIVKEAPEYWALVPDVPGVYGRGGTVSDATDDVTAALADYAQFLGENGEPLPDAASDAVEVRFADVSLQG